MKFPNHMNENKPNFEFRSWNKFFKKNKKHDVCMMWMQKDFITKTSQEYNKIMIKILTQN